jgi:hypothetical protein
MPALFQRGEINRDGQELTEVNYNTGKHKK